MHINTTRLYCSFFFMVSSKTSDAIFIFDLSNKGTMYMLMDFHRNWNILIEGIRVRIIWNLFDA